MHWARFLSDFSSASIDFGYRENAFILSWPCYTICISSEKATCRSRIVLGDALAPYRWIIRGFFCGGGEKLRGSRPLSGLSSVCGRFTGCSRCRHLRESRPPHVVASKCLTFSFLFCPLWFLFLSGRTCSPCLISRRLREVRRCEHVRPLVEACFARRRGGCAR